MNVGYFSTWGVDNNKHGVKTKKRAIIAMNCFIKTHILKLAF